MHAAVVPDGEALHLPAHACVRLVEEEGGARVVRAALEVAAGAVAAPPPRRDVEELEAAWRVGTPPGGVVLRVEEVLVHVPRVEVVECVNQREELGEPVYRYR